MQIFVYKNGQQLGPLSEEEVKSQLATGILSRQDMVWWDGQAGWAPLEQTPLAGSVTVSVPAPTYASASVTAAGALAPERTSVLAVISLVSGILSFFLVVTFIVAIICGHLSLSEIKRNPVIKGRGMAIAGLILGYVYPVIAIASIVVLVMLGEQVKQTFNTINAQVEAAQTNNAPANGQ